MFRRPSLSLAEIVWRFSFGAAAWISFTLAALAYLDTLPVTGSDLMKLRTGHPVFVSQAIVHIFHGSALRVVLAGVILFAALATLWILTASLGRGATLGPLLLHIRSRAHLIQSTYDPVAAPSAPLTDAPESIHLRSLAGLHFLRVALALAACIGALGAITIANFASTKASPRPSLVFLLSAGMLLLIWALWSLLSWFLAAAPIFVVREGKDAFGALLDTATLFRKHAGSVIAVGSWFGLTHLMLLIAASTVVSFPLAFACLLPPAIVLGAAVLFTMAYFALVDALYIGRLAGYVAILEAPPPPPPPLPPTPPPMAAPALADRTQITPPEVAMVDQSENILSDTSAPSGEHTDAPPTNVDDGQTEI
jgi:hypothetical protein